jgi:hypothetical protein
VTIDPGPGGVLIEGTEHELQQLALALQEAVDQNEAKVVFRGVGPVTVWLLLEEDWDTP